MLKTFLSVLIISTNIIFAQTKDSIKTYNLEEITVKSGIIIEPKTTTELSMREIEKSNAENIYELTKYIPSVKFQTNSRGESLFYIRGSGKRQTTILFDGVPLNIPWDNRIDLSMIPSLAIGSLSAVKGIPSVTFGANTPAGVVTIYSKEPEKAFNAAFDLSTGDSKYQSANAFFSGKMKEFSYLISGASVRKDNFRLSSEFVPSADQTKNERINTDYKNLSFYTKIGYNFGGGSNINLSVNWSDAEKGVAPETDVVNPRYWRYPVWNRTAVSLFGSNYLFGSSSSLMTYSLAFTNFKQQIDQYTDNTYSAIEEIEKDDNNTIFGRFLFTGFINNYSLIKLSLNGYATVHKEKYLSDNYKEYRYSQNLFSAGIEYEYLSSNSIFLIGMAYDLSATPETGGKPHSDATGALSFNSSFTYTFNDLYSARINMGRKTRFATLREAYSGALGRFVLNPDLKPEVMNSIDGGIIYNASKLSGEVNLFYNLTEEGIVRESLPSNKFMRVNKEAIRTYGIEIISKMALNDQVTLSFNFTLMDSKGKNQSGEFTDTLEYKPSVISSAVVDYRPIGGFTIFAEIKFLSEEYGLKDGSIYFQRLPEYLLLNTRFGYEMNYYKDHPIEFYFRINNLFDKLYYTQWGLPDPGREFIGGFNIKF